MDGAGSVNVPKALVLYDGFFNLGLAYSTQRSLDSLHIIATMS